MADTAPLVTTDWLEKNLHAPNVRVVDIRGYVTSKPIRPGVEEATYRGAPEEYQVSHIPGAVFIDWTKDIVDLDDPVPAQIAPPERFAATMGRLGIGDETHVVVVDHAGGQFATRLWWALQYYGHEQVSVLDGGYHRWREENRPLDANTVAVEPAVFTPKTQPSWRTTADSLLTHLGRGDVQILDARDSSQYTGARHRGPRGGHIPGAINVPSGEFFAEGGGYLPVEEVRRQLSEKGVRSDRPVIAYCNGGVSATVALFNLYRIGRRDLTVYDGSWNEWGQRLELPVEP